MATHAHGPKGTPLCGAKTRSGSGNCRREAGWGTDHFGHGRCKFHGGSTPSHRKAAALSIGQRLAGELDCQPHEALLEMLRRSLFAVRCAEAMVWLLTDDEITVTDLREEITTGGQFGGGTKVVETTSAELHLWVRTYFEASDRCAKYAKMCVEAKVDQAATSWLNQQADALGDFTKGLLEDFGLRDDPRAPEIVRRRFQLLEGGKAA